MFKADLFPPIEPRSIRDIGTVTKIAPGEKLEGTEIKEPNLAAGLKPITAGGTKTATKPATTGTSFTTNVNRPASGGPTVHNPVIFQGPGFDLDSFFRLANESRVSPEDLMQILRG
jgi:hypothetical protein